MFRKSVSVGISVGSYGLARFFTANIVHTNFSTSASSFFHHRLRSYFFRALDRPTELPFRSTCSCSNCRASYPVEGVDLSSHSQEQDDTNRGHPGKWSGISSMAKLINGHPDEMPAAFHDHKMITPVVSSAKATAEVNGYSKPGAVIENGHELEECHMENRNGHAGVSKVLQHGDSKRNGHSPSVVNGNHAADFTGRSTSNGKWKPFLIGVAGGTASGKTSVCHKIMCKLGQNDLENHKRRVVTISSDSFYRVLNQDERERARDGEFNFDHPDALDYDLILSVMHQILRGDIVKIPVYDFVTHSRRKDENIIVYPADVVLLEGILVFYFPELRNMFELKLFVDMEADTRLARRMVRDIKERGRDIANVIHQYTLFVKPAFDEFCNPTKKYADVIIPRGAENDVAINLIVQHISEHLLPKAIENGSPRRSMQDDALAMVARNADNSSPRPRDDQNDRLEDKETGFAAVSS